MRIDEVYAGLKQLVTENGVSASELADFLALNRANVSNDLNKLVASGKAKKRAGKPVLFYPIQRVPAALSNLEKFSLFSEANPSLFSALEQAKAAVLYPPNGMNMLILGETGGGKSMFAELMYDYAKAVDKLEPNAPFVIFNCADYANNPQLLLAQLFGSKKGAYTGATEERIGLLEKAHGGVLFLDEVHRLPPEGQEMFFTFIDKGFFRRLGETEVERRVDVRIFSATTEEPESSLLRTFSRRFPMVIELLSLKERSFQERFNLIKYFFNYEAAHLQQSVTVSVNTLRALLSYDCPNNIGQLKSDIRFACAGAYAEYVSGKSNQIMVYSRILPEYVSSALLNRSDQRSMWNAVIGLNRQAIIFNGDNQEPLYEDNQITNIYDLLSLRVTELKSLGVSKERLEDEIEKDIADYFQTHINRSEYKFDSRKLENLVTPKVLRLTEEIIRYAENKFQRSLGNNVYYGLASHIEKAAERVRQNKTISNPQLNRIRTMHDEVFNVALDCLRMIERVMEITLPLDEAGFLAMFFIYSERDVEQQRNDVQVLVVAHGRQTASAIAETANELLGVKYAVAFNVPLEDRAQQVMEHIIEYLASQPIKSDVLLLVDMGSLTTFGAAIEARLNIRVKTLKFIGTMHVIEAIQEAMNGRPLEEIYQSVLNVSKQEMEVQQQQMPLAEIARRTVDKKLAVVTLCTTGEGTARVMDNLLSKVLAHRKNVIEIICLSLSDETDIYRHLDKIAGDYTVVAIISPFRLKTPIIQFDLNDILLQEGVNHLQSLIDLEATYVMIEGTLSQMLQHIDPAQILPEIKAFNFNVSKALDTSPSSNMLIGLTMHIACMLERLKSGQETGDFPDKHHYMLQHADELSIIEQHAAIFEKALDIVLPKDELCSLHRFFLHA
jgi:transcriptional regulatory protein LevR/transcriptional regulator with AAA-type ATPase domain